MSGAAPGAVDPAEIGCRPFLLGPPRLDVAAFAPVLDRTLAGGGVAGFLLDPATAEREATALGEVCHRHGVAFLLADDAELAIEAAADGLHLWQPEGVAAARARLGPERILGAACGHSRHAAMVAGEEGADYVAFGTPGGPVDEALLELATWWSELFVLPCLVLGAIGPEEARRLAAAGADLVAPGPTLWAHPAGPEAALEGLRRALDGA